MGNIMAGFYERESAQKASALRTALITAGIEVPADLENGLASLGWTIPAPDAPDGTALFTAKTESEYRKAAQKYADALADGERLNAVREVAQTARLNVVSAALTSARQEVISEAIELFDEAAEQFAMSVLSFPDVEISTLTTDQFSYFAKARGHADDMRRAYTVYTAVHGADPTQGHAADAAWFRVADLDDTDALRAVYEANQRHRTGPLAPLAPYYALVRNGAALRLVTPDQAEASYREANERQTVKDEENRPAPSTHPNHAGLSQGSTDRLRMNMRAMRG